MTSILLVAYDPPGHTEPVQALGLALAAAGHRVTVFATPAAAARVRQAGLDIQVPRRWRPGGPLPAAVIASGDGAAMFRHLVFGSLIDMTEDIEAAVDQCGAELIVSDTFVPGGGLAAQRLGLPWVSLSCSPVPTLDSYTECFDPPVLDCFDAQADFATLGVPDQPSSLLRRTSPYLHLIPNTPGFAGLVELPPHVALVGPLVPLPDPSAERLGPSARPTVAVTASTIPPEMLRGRGYAQDRYLRTVVRAMDGLAATAVLTGALNLGASTVDAMPDNVQAVGRVPHDALFDRCRAVVTHAGWGAVSRALVRGLPLVLLPIVNDEPYIATRCAQLGLGIALDPMTVTVPQLREAIHAVCTQPGYARDAAAFAAGLRAAAPLATAVALVSAVPDTARVPVPTTAYVSNDEEEVRDAR